MTMTLATKEDVRNLARIRKIDLTAYTDADINDLVDYAVDYLEGETGRVFDKQTKAETKYNNSGSKFVTKYWPLISVDSIYVNKTLVEPNMYNVDLENGIVYFMTDYRIRQAGFRETYDVIINYTAGYNSVQPSIKRLILDIVMLCVKYNLSPYPGFITQITEAGSTLQFDPAHNSMLNIEGRIQNLTVLRMEQI
jgi:hypothetical protein